MPLGHPAGRCRERRRDSDIPQLTADPDTSGISKSSVSRSRTAALTRRRLWIAGWIKTTAVRHSTLRHGTISGPTLLQPVPSGSGTRPGGRRRSLVFATCFGLGLRVVLTLFADVILAIRPGLFLSPAPTGPSALLPRPGTWQAFFGSAMAALGRYPLHADRGGRLLDTGFHAAFLPLFPILERAVSPLAGGSFAVAGVVVDTIALVAGMYLLHRLATHEVGTPMRPTER